MSGEYDTQRVVSAADIVAEQRAKESEKKWEEIASIKSFEWTELPPIVVAKLLTRKPFKGKFNEPDFYLTPDQALVYAFECRRMGLSPFSDEAFFDAKAWRVNATASGKRKQAAKSGNIGVPQFEGPLYREWPAGKPKNALFPKDMGYKCTIKRGEESAIYTSWASEWFRNTQPWKDITEHMLRTRAEEKCYVLLSGSQISELPDDRDIEREARQLAAGVAPEPLALTGSDVEVVEAIYQPNKGE